jgi:carbon storage regulator
MLVLSRKLNQAIMIGDDVRVIVVAVDRDQVKIGIEAPREISVHRSEVYEEIRRTKKADGGAAAPTIRGSEQSSAPTPAPGTPAK